MLLQTEEDLTLSSLKGEMQKSLEIYHLRINCQGNEEQKRISLFCPIRSDGVANDRFLDVQCEHAVVCAGLT